MALALRRPYRRAPGGGAVTERDVPARPPRTRVAAARGAWAVGSVMMMIARLVRLAASIIVLFIVAAIVLRLLGANTGNVIVRDIHDVGRFFVGPFHNVFSIKNPKGAMAANWGLAALVYLVVGHAIASVIARMAPTGVHPAQPVV